MGYSQGSVCLLGQWSPLLDCTSSSSCFLLFLGVPILELRFPVGGPQVQCRSYRLAVVRNAPVTCGNRSQGLRTSHLIPRGLLTAVEALRVNPQQHGQTVPGPQPLLRRVVACPTLGSPLALACCSCNLAGLSGDVVYESRCPRTDADLRCLPARQDTTDGRVGEPMVALA
jgi:hypothetical protein